MTPANFFSEALRSRVRDMGVSVDEAVTEMSSPMPGLAKAEEPEGDNPFMRFCGILPKGEGARLRASVAAQRTIDKESLGHEGEKGLAGE